jgi:hypothetical protein
MAVIGQWTASDIARAGTSVVVDVILDETGALPALDRQAEGLRRSFCREEEKRAKRRQQNRVHARHSNARSRLFWAARLRRAGEWRTANSE